MFPGSHAYEHVEPMTLGSPTNQQHPPERFLPGYLMGDHTATPSPPTRLWSASSGSSSPRPALGRGNSFMSSTSGGMNVHTPRSETRAREMTSHRTKEKEGAPPVKPLFEDMVASPSAARIPSLSTDDSLSQYGVAETSGLQSSFYSPAIGSNVSKRIPPSPAQVDPFYSQGESIKPDDELDETWVSVFGFPPNASSFILMEFAQYGVILKHVVASEGNWMHIHYQSKLQAKRALSKNGQIFGRVFMVGVKPCIDKSVMLEHGMEGCILENSNHSRMETPLNLTANQSLTRYTPIRPLTAAYKAAATDHQVIQGTNTPQKSSSVLSKAMEYMFGW